MVGMIPIFDKKKATRPKLRTEDGPQGAARRRIEITHQCLGALLEGWNALTEGVKILQWADGVWRKTRILLQALFSDQPEADTYCCDHAQSCKLCHCPRDQLHLPAEHAPKYAHSQEVKVNRAADGMLNDKARKLFDRQGSKWKPTDECNKAAYERQRKALNGTHVMPNRLWRIKGFDVQRMVCMYACICRYMYVFDCICLYVHVCVCMCTYQSYSVLIQAYKDPMHAYDHGVAITISKATVKIIHKLEDSLGLSRNTLVSKLTGRLHNLCSSLNSKHTTLMGFTHQSIVSLFETLTTPNKKGQKQSPVVDAGDVQKIMQLLPYVLDGLADEAIAEHRARGGAAVSDPFPDVIMAINDWLHWYHLARTPEPDDDDVARLTDMGKALLGTLERVFPFKVRYGKYTERSMWCNEKVHSILHVPRTLRRMGRCCHTC